MESNPLSKELLKNMIEKPSEQEMEQYKLNASLYKKYKENIRSLESTFEKEKKDLGNPHDDLVYGGLFTIILFIICYAYSEKSLNLLFIPIIYAFLLIIGVIIGLIKHPNKIKKIKEQEEQIEEVRKLKGNIYERLELFEKPICDYYHNQIEELFQNNLYKKKSGSNQFQESLIEFELMIKELSTINSNFVTNSIPLEKYKTYLEKRQVNHNLKTSKDSEELILIRNFANNLIKRQEQKIKEVIPPEKTYRTARKIDNWEEINRKRKITGLKGEEIAVVIEQEYLESINRKDLADKVRHVSQEDGDGLGYDILSFFKNGIEKYIEVKSTTTSFNAPFYLSRNELGFLNEHDEDYFLYRILVTADTPQFKVYSSSEVLEMNEIVPVQYLVRTK
jgi:hypothetical protein